MVFQEKKDGVVLSQPVSTPKSAVEHTPGPWKERPILFSAPMVRALLAGTKTQTRRAMKPQPFVEDQRGLTMWNTSKHSATSNCDAWLARCPYGLPGDMLWVRETWSFIGQQGVFDLHQAMPGNCKPIYRADGVSADRWWPSIHMYRWASRLTLRITDVRAERLRDISEDDALAEGIEPPTTEREDHDWTICPACGGTGLHGSLGEHMGYVEVDCAECDTAIKRYRHLWEHINGPGSWDVNPWVWAVSFGVSPTPGTVQGEGSSSAARPQNSTSSELQLNSQDGEEQ